MSALWETWVVLRKPWTSGNNCSNRPRPQTNKQHFYMCLEQARHSARTCSSFNCLHLDCTRLRGRTDLHFACPRRATTKLATLRTEVGDAESRKPRSEALPTSLTAKTLASMQSSPAGPPVASHRHGNGTSTVRDAIGVLLTQPKNLKPHLGMFGAASESRIHPRTAYFTKLNSTLWRIERSIGPWILKFQSGRKAEQQPKRRFTRPPGPALEMSQVVSRLSGALAPAFSCGIAEVSGLANQDTTFSGETDLVVVQCGRT